MVPGHGLVHAQNFDFVLRTHPGLVQVHPVDAGTATVAGRPRVIGGRRIGCNRVGNRLHAVRHARQLAEELDELGVDAFARREILLVKIVGVLEVELRVGAQVFEEFPEAAIETHFLDDIHHLAADAFDLVESDTMNLVRRQARRRVGSGAEFVPGRAVGQFGQTDALARGWQVGLVKVSIQFAIGRQHGLFNDLGCLGAEALAVRRRDGFRKGRKRFEERTVGSELHDLHRNLVRQALHQDLWRRVSGLAAFFGQRDRLVDNVIDLGQPRYPVVVVLDRDQSELVGQVVEVLHAATLRKRHQVSVELVFVDVVLELAAEELVVELVVLGQRRTINRVHAAQKVPGLLVALFDRPETAVRPFAVVTSVAHHRRHDRRRLQRPLPMLAKQCIEVLSSIGERNATDQKPQDSESNSGLFHSNPLICGGEHCYCQRGCWQPQRPLAMIPPLVYSGCRRDPVRSGRRRRNLPGNAQAEGL